MRKKVEKSFRDRKKLETSLINDLVNIQKLGSFLNVCMNDDAKNTKYEIAKKRYVDLLDKTTSALNHLKKVITKQEKDLQRDQTRDKLRKANEKVEEDNLSRAEQAQRDDEEKMRKRTKNSIV